MRRKLRLEQLERRELLAADLGVGAAAAPVDLKDAAEEAGLTVTPDQVDTVAVIEFKSSLAVAYAADINNHAVRVGQTILANEATGVRSYSAVGGEPGDFQERDYLEIGTGVNRVVSIGNHVLIEASRPVRIGGTSTTLVLASLDDDGQIHEIDRLVRDSPVSGVWVVDGRFMILWQGTTFTGAVREDLTSRLGTITGEGQPYNYSLYDIVDPAAQVLPRESLLGIRGSVVFSNIDMGKFVAYGKDGAYLIDSSGSPSISEPFQVPDALVRVAPDGLVRFPAISVSDQGLSLRGELTPEFGGGYGSVLLDQDFDVADVQQEATGDVVRLRLEEDRIKRVFNDGRVPSLTVYKAFDSPDLRLVSEVDGEYREQLVSLPDARLGFRPFVLDADTLVALRAKTDVLLNDPSVDLRTAKPVVTAYLMKRSAEGDFEVVGQASLGDFDFRGTGYVSDTGTITVRSSTSVKIIRVSEDALSIQTMAAVDPMTSQIRTSITGFDTATVTTVGDTTTLLGVDAETTSPIGAPVVSEQSSVAVKDVNKDGFVTALDVLLLVNWLNQGNSSSQASAELVAFDTNRDGHVTPSDALVLINYLNNLASSSAEGESAAFDSAGLARPAESEQSPQSAPAKTSPVAESSPVAASHAASTEYPRLATEPSSTIARLEPIEEEASLIDLLAEDVLSAMP